MPLATQQDLEANCRQQLEALQVFKDCLPHKYYVAWKHTLANIYDTFSGNLKWPLAKRLSKVRKCDYFAEKRQV